MNKLETGQQIGGLVFVKRAPARPNDKTSYGVFKCSPCGGEFIARIYSVKCGHTASCGCITYTMRSERVTRHIPKIIDENGKKLMPEFAEIDKKRFWGKVKVTNNIDECWIYTGKGGDYGTFSMGNVELISHRAAYFLHYGDDPKDSFVLHSCHVRGCCNPTHLSLGDNQKNMNDMVLANRQHKGTQINTCKLTGVDVLKIRNQYGNGQRIKNLSEEYKICPSTVDAIVKNRTWKSLL